MKTAASQERQHPPARAGASVTSVAMLCLILAPALVSVSGAEALPPGKASAHARAPASTPAAGQRAAAPASAGRAGGHRIAGDASLPRALVQTDPADDGALQLLRRAAAAGRTVSYHGVQIISWWSPDGATTVAVDVTQESRRATLLQAVGVGTRLNGQMFTASELGARPGDVLGITEETLDLLSANYHVVAAGAGSACGRPATIVEALRGDGTVAGKFWLDNVTKITLRRELFDGKSRMINESTFVDLNLGLPAATGSLQAGSAAARPWRVMTPADVARLRARGWPVPAELPGGLVLFDARQGAAPTGQVFQFGYSDGLSGVSLFVQRGGLPGQLSGWRKVEVGGRAVYARDPIPRGLTWSSRGYVLTLIADAPAATIGTVVRALPYEGQRGFWSRLRHGFERVLSWVNPLG